jgi:hypothetical protein
MAVLIALEALGHDALTIEEFTVFKLAVMEEALLNKCVCLLRSSDVSK